MFKNKFHVIALVVALVMGALLMVAQIPATHTSPKNLPIAIVDADKSSTSQAIVKQLTSVTTTGGANATTIKWTVVKSERAVKQAMDDQKYYGALVIEPNFAQNVMSLATPNPTKPEMRILVNQAKNATAAAGVQNALTMTTTKVGSAMGTQVLDKMQAMNMPVPATTAKVLAQPVDVSTKVMHATTNKATASAAFFQPVWMGALLGSVMLLFAQKGIVTGDIKHAWRNKGVEVLVMAVVAIASGFGTTEFAHVILNYNYDNFVTVALYASLASFAFQLVMLGVMSWLGMAGVPLFVLLMLFAAPLMTLAPEMLTHFYSAYVMPWLPMRFLLDGMKGIVYYNVNFWNGNTQSLLWVALIGAGLLLTSIYKPTKQTIA